ncbi:MAG: T9SS type A sorting domain-containing protein [Vicingaceae bacterium]
MRKISSLFAIMVLFTATAFSQNYFVTLPQQCNTPNPATNDTLRFTGTLGNAAGDAILKIASIGDIGAGTELLDYYDENGTLIGTTGNVGNCNLDSFIYTMPLADVLAFSSDGVIEIGIDPSPGVNTNQCNAAIGAAGYCSVGQLQYLAQANGIDASVTSIDDPTTYCAGSQSVVATIGNFGNAQINSVDVNWEVNGVAQPTFTYSSLLDTLNGSNPNTAQVTLGTANFPAGASTIKVYTSNPNGMADSFNGNDTALLSVTSAPAPTSIAISNVTLTTAMVTATGGAGTIDYEYGPAGFTPGSGTTGTSASTTFTITGLTQGTAYDVYVRSNCGSGDVSSYVGPQGFLTSYGVPYFQDFEAFPTDIEQNPWPEGWSSSTAADPNWISFNPATSNVFRSGSTGPDVDHTLGNQNGTFIFMETSGGTVGATADYVSPPVYFDPTHTTVEFSFWYYFYGSNIDKMYVIADTNGVETVLDSIVGQQQTTSTEPWREWSGFLNGFEGKSVTVKFRGVNVSCCTGDIAIDDVALDPVLPLNAALSDVVSPSGSLCPGSLTPVVEVSNNGSTDLNSVKVVWDINNGAILDSVTYTNTITSGSTANVTLGTVNISAGTIYDVKFYTKEPNGMADMLTADDTLEINGLQTGISGVVTVDPGLPASASNYVDFASLEANLNSTGVCGSVVVDVAPGVYTENLTLDNVPGLDMNNTLTIDGGDSSLVTLAYGTGTNPYLVSVINSPYVTIKNFTLENTYTGTADHYGVHLSRGTHHDSLLNLRIKLNPTNTIGAEGITASTGVNDNFGEGNNANFTTVMGCNISGGDYSIHFEGGSAGSWNVGNTFVNNICINMDGYGMYFDEQDSLNVIGNSVSGQRSTFADGIYGLDCMNMRVNENYVSAEDWAMYFSDANSDKASDIRAEFINNMVISASDYGIYMTDANRIDFYHNSVHVEGTTPAVRFFGTITDSIDMRNNVLSSLTSEALEISEPDVNVFDNLDHNVYYTATGANLFDIDGTSYADLAAYQTAQPLFNANSLDGDPQFLSTTDLHIIGAFINDAGDNSVGVSVDIDGDSRPMSGSTVVDPGADEFDPPSCPPVANLAALNASLDSVTIRWDQIAAANGYEYIIVPAGSPQSSGTAVLTTLDSVRVGGLTASTAYDLYVRVDCGRGSYSLWIGPITFNTASGIPYFQDFENFPTDIEQNPWPEGWTSSTSVDPNWISFTPATSAVFRSGNTGPDVDHTLGNPNGTFLFMETSGGTVGDSADMVSPPIFVDQTQNAFELSYWYFLYGANIDRLEVLVESGGAETLLRTYTGQLQAAGTDPWAKDSILLTGFAGSSVKIIFRGFNVSCCTGDIAIDDISLDIVAPIDAGLTGQPEPIDDSLQCYTATEPVSIDLINSGTSALDFSTDNATITVNVSGAITQTLTTTLTDNSLNGGSALASGSSLNIPVGTIDLTATGTYTFNTSVAQSNDGNSTNDAFTRSITVLPYNGGTITGNDTICAGDTTTLSVDGTYGTIQWQEFDGSTWNNIPGATGNSVDVDPNALTDYRVVACGSANSAVFTVLPIIVSAPTAVGDTVTVNCGNPGTAYGVASSGNGITSPTFAWYDSLTGGNSINTGGAYTVSSDGDSLAFTATPGQSAPSIDTVYVAEQIAGGNGPSLLITEMDLGGPDALEITNASSSTVDVTGWTVAISDNYTVINDVNANVQTLSGTMAPGATMYWTDGAVNPWGNNILWNPGAYPTFTGWILIIDDQGNIVDFLASNWLAADIATFNVTVNGFTITNPIASGHWVGDGVSGNALPGGSSLYRQGNADNNDMTDFIQNPIDLGTVNTGLNLPFSGGCEGPRVPVILEINCIVGLDDELANVEGFSLYPNPSNGQFTMTLNTKTSADYTISIRDVQGKLMFEEQLNVNGGFVKDYDFESLAKGVYFMNLQSDDESIVRKIVIQ